MRPIATLLFMFWLGACAASGNTSSSTTDATAPKSDTVSPGADTAVACQPVAAWSGLPCNPLCGASASPAGQYCGVDKAGKVGHVPVGEQKLGFGCNDISPCAAGGCVEVPGKGRKCQPFCAQDADCEAGQKCALSLSASSVTLTLCGPNATTKVCDIFKQDCADGLACTLNGSKESCLKPGPKKKGEACDGTSFCEKGLVCVSDKCHEVCNPHTSGPDPKCTNVCPDRTGNLDGNDDVAVCSEKSDKPKCTLLTGKECASGEGCYVTSSSDGPRCETAGTAAPGKPCTSDTDCAAGATCVGNACRKLCDPLQQVEKGCSDITIPCTPLGWGAGYCDE